MREKPLPEELGHHEAVKTSLEILPEMRIP